MKNLSLLNRSGMSPDGTSRKGRYCLDPILSRFSLASLICLCMLTIGVGQMWGQASSATVTDGGTYVVCAYSGSKYYALPNNTTAGTWSGTEVAVNGSGQVTTADAPTWTMKRDGTSARYYLTYKSGNNTYYLYKNGTNTSNKNIKGATGDKNYWTFTAGTGGNAGKYQVIAYNRGSNHTCLTYTSSKWQVNGTSGYSIILLELAPACSTKPTVGSSLTSVSATANSITATVPISAIGGCDITENGLVYSTSVATPTVGAANCTKVTTTACGASASNKTVTISDLTCNQSYYVRGYATNAAGTSYTNVTTQSTSACPLYTVTLMDDSDTRTQGSYGAAVTLPSRAGCSGYTFAGWTKSWVTAQTSWTTTAPTVIPAGSYTPAGDENLYPVYTKTEGGGTTDITVVPGTYTNKGSGNYGSGAERTGTVSTINFGGHYITGNQANSPVNPCSAGTYIQCQASNANIYNKTAMPGNITKVVVNQYAAQNIDLYCGTSQLMASDNTSTGQTPSGTLQTAQSAATTMTWNVGGSYTYFDLKKGSGTSYITSIVITYSSAVTSYISVPSCCTNLASINGSVSWSNGQATVSWDAAAGLSSWVLKYKRSADSDIPANWTSYAGSFGTATGRTSNSTAISSLTAGTAYDFKITGTSDGSTYCAGEFSETATSTVPKITPSGTLTDLGYQEGEDPIAQSFTVAGTALTRNLSIEAPTNFEICLTNSATPSDWKTHGTSITITKANAESGQTVWVRAVSGLSEGDDPSGDIEISGGGAASVNVAIEATITEACTAPSSVTITGTTKYFGGQTISLTATPSGGAGEASYQWQKKVSGVWTNVANGGGISGATTNNLQISSCTHSNSGGYRCVVSTGSTCSTKSHADNTDGYGVHVFTVYGGYVGDTWSDEELTLSAGTTGTATVHLNAGTLYKFHIRSNNGAYYCNGTADYDGDGNGDGGTDDGWYVLKTTSNINFGRSSKNYRIYTGPEGDYTITVDIANALTGGDYVTVGITYPTPTHPSAGYAYFEKPNEWTNVYLYWYTDDNSRLSGWSGTPEITTTTTICGTTYYYTPLGSSFSNVIFKGNGSNQWTTLATSGFSGKYLDKTTYASPAWVAFPTYTISYAGGTGSTGSMSDETGIAGGGSQTLTAFNTIAKAGYTFSCWHADQDVTIGGSTVDEGDDIVDGATIQNICGNIALTAQWTANTNTAYTVKHYQQNIANDDYTLYATQNLTGTTDASVTPATNSYTGFTAPSTQTVTILGNGSQVVNYYYTRNSYNLTWNMGGGTTTSAGTGIASGVSATTTSNVKFGTSLTAPTVTKTGYTFSAWSSAVASTMPAAATTYTATWSATNYTITYNLNSGTNPGGAPTGFTIESSAITLPTPTRAGYTFGGWYAASNFSGDVQTTIAAGSTGNKEYWAKWTAKEDTYKTALHTGASGWTSYASGVTKSGAGYTIPAPSSVTKGATSSCEDTHYHFAGWVADDYKGSPSGHIIPASGTTDATGTTYWAVWEKEGAGGGGTSSITITRSTTGITATGYDSGVERTWTQSEIDFGGHYIMTNNKNTPSGASASQYIVMQKSNGTLYNTEELPGAITEVKVIQYSALACNVYCGDERLMASDNTSTGQTPSGTLITKPDDATTMTWTISASNNYRFFALKAYTSSSSGTNYITSVKVTYSTITYEDPKAVCEACVATPSISGVSLTGSGFSTTSVPVQATGASAGDNCSLASYGFYWGASADPSTNNTSSNNLSTGTFSATLTGPFVIGTTYHYRAYGTNEADNTGYSSDATFTLQNVTFNMHSHGGDAPATQVVPQGGKATDPGDPSETGYTFDGWYDNSSYTGSAWNFSSNTVGSGGVTLHAKWTEKPKYTITLNAGNGTVSADGWTAGDSPTWSKTQANGDEEITFPAANPGCAGWVFKGWKQGSAVTDEGSFTPDKTTGATLTPTGNVTYYAVYRQSTPSGTTYTKITNAGDLVSTDYAIVAAFSESGSYYAMQNDKSGTYMKETSFTHADSWENDDADYIWKVLVFGDKVAFYNADEGKFLTIVDGAWVLDTDGQLFTYSFNSTTKAWTFTSPSGKQLIYSTQFYVGDSQNKAIYLYKRGEAESGNYYTNPSCSDYTVSGVANPAAGGSVQLTATAAKNGDKVWACYTVDEDYNFTNWTISGTSVSPTSATTQFVAITVGSGDVTVTANFTAKVWRTVTWKVNGVTLTGGDLGSASVKVENGHNITILPPTPTSCDDSGVGASDQFVGWVVNSENWGNKINDVSAKHIYKRASQFPVVSGDVTYHAVWAASDNTQNHWEKVTDIDDVEAGFKYAIISFDDAYYLKNTDQSTDKPSVYAVTKTSGNINYTSDMEFTASEGSYGGFVFTSVAVSGVKIWGGSANDGVRVSTTSACSDASDEWYMVQDATYGAIMTAVDSKYLATYGTQDWRNYATPNAGNRAANLHKYAYGYKQYMTLCCDNAITIAAPSKTGSGTVTFTEDSPYPTCLGETTDIHVNIAPTNGYKCTILTFSREDDGDIDIDPDISVPFTAATDFTLTVEQNANTTLNTSVTFVALHDYYIDNMHYNSTADKSGNYGTAPTLSNETKGEECTGLHYKFVGWIPETDMDMDTGVPTTTANMVAGGATGKYATGTNYYAIWAEEE